MTHELKIQKQWADAKLAGEKPFEIRRNDRGFQKGDIVHYTVVDPKTGEPWRKPEEEILYGNDDGRHSIERCDFVITYVREGADGLEKGYCVYADQPMPRGKSFVPDTPEKKFLLNMAKDTANCPPVCLSAFDHAREGTDFSCPDLNSNGFHCTRGRGECCHQEKHPVSAVLGSGVTPSTEDGDSVPPPVPLADIPGKKENHTDEDSIAKGKSACECFMPPAVEGALCHFSRVSLLSFGKKCSCKESPHFNEDCILDRR